MFQKLVLGQNLDLISVLQCEKNRNKGEARVLVKRPLTTCIFNFFQDFVLIRLIKRFVTFLLLLLVSLIAFYFVGNYQNFMDSTLNIILQVIKLVAILLVIFSVFGIISVILGAIRFKKPSYLFLLILYILSILISSILLAYSFVITIKFQFDILVRFYNKLFFPLF